MTGDRNPLHYDADMASQSPFGGLIVQGGVSSGLLNAIVAGGLPGPGSVFLGVEWPFVKAAKADKEIIGRVEITSVRDDKRICTLPTSVRTAQGEPASSAPPRNLHSAAASAVINFRRSEGDQTAATAHSAAAGGDDVSGSGKPARRKPSR